MLAELSHEQKIIFSLRTENEAQAKEIAELKAKVAEVRWRKYPEEKPLEKGKYLFRYENKKGRKIIEDFVVFDIIYPPHVPFENSLSIEWMPIPDIGGDA